jgi:ketosteroid isomerase-like protein
MRRGLAIAALFTAAGALLTATAATEAIGDPPSPAAATAAPGVIAPATTPYDSAWPQFSPDGGSIVFGSTREDGDWEIHVMRADGTGVRRLTRSPGRDAHPVFTPDGRSILFQSPRGNPDGNIDLWSMHADGADPRRLVEAPGFDGVPAASRDGKKLVYQHGTPVGEGWHWEIHLADADGLHDRALTAHGWNSQVPVFSPDGRRLILFANPGGRDRLFLMDLATRAVTPLVPGAPAAPGTPAASGTQAAPGTPSPPGDWDDQVPSFSPDGRFVAFTSTRDGGRDLYRIEIATHAITRLTTGFDIWSQAAWSPDGTRILFSAKAGGVEEIFSVAATGGEPVRLTRGAEGMRPGDARLEVKAALASYARLLQGMDSAGIAAAYEEHGELLDPGMAPLKGRAAITAFLDSFQGVVIESSSMTPETTEVWGTAALTWGAYAQRVRVGDKPAEDYRGRFVAEWSRQSDGRWLLRRLLTQPAPGGGQ